MFERTPDSTYARIYRNIEFFSKVPLWRYNEFVWRVDPKVAVDIPLMCTGYSDLLQLNDSQWADLNALVTVKPDITDIRRDVYPSSEPRLGVRRQYLNIGIVTETQYAPVTRGLLGMQIRARRERQDDYDITALYIGEVPTARAVLDAYTNLRMYGGSYPFHIEQLPSDHLSFDLLERHMKDGALGIRYRHVHTIGNFCATNSAKDVFRPDV